MKDINYTERRKKIRSLGREVTIPNVKSTRSIIAPLLKIAPFDDVQIQRDVFYGEDERHRLDIFTASQSLSTDHDIKKPLLIFIHGGGFIAGDKYSPDSPFYDNIGTWAVRNGFNGINITYRLAPQHQWPSGVEDVHLAMQWIVSNAEKYDLDASRIFLFGHSAGAVHAASYIAHPELYAPNHHALSGAILVSGLYNFESMQASEKEQAYLGEDGSLYAVRSSVQGLVDSDIPFLIALSEFDAACFEAQGLELITALQKKYNKMPGFAYLMGQNHMSSVLSLGLEGDLLAAQLKQFIEDHK